MTSFSFQPRRTMALLALLIGTACSSMAASAPAPERLLPADTLLMVTVPDAAKLREAYSKSSQMQFWNDPAMKPFRDKFMAKWQEELVKPLERELNISFDNYAALFQGQVTLGVTQNGWGTDSDKEPGVLLLLDAKDKSDDLKAALADLRAKWIAKSDKPLRTEKIREFDFLVVPLSTNDAPKTIKKFLPRSLEYHELGEDEEPTEKKPSQTELMVGQVQSFLLVGNSAAALEQVVHRLGGGALPSLGEQAAFQSANDLLFRESLMYGWLNAKALLDMAGRSMSEKKENPDAPNPFEMFKPEKLLTASGISGVKSAAFTVSRANDGTLVQMHLGVPESARTGLLKVIAGEPKESAPPPFIPAEAVKFSRYRLDGQKAWSALEKMLAEISPQWVQGLNFLLDTANTAARDKDPSFDVRKNIIGNIGDDLISYEKPGKDLKGGPAVFLLGSPNAEMFAGSLKNILVVAQPIAPEEREFLGRKVFSVPLPSLPSGMNAGVAKPSTPRTLHYAASRGYVAFSTDVASLEEFLRSSDNPPKPLKSVAGLAEAAQKVTGPGTSFFSYENQAEEMRAAFELLSKSPDSYTNIESLNLVANVPGMAAPEKSLREWMDFSLLPPFEKVAKYFGIAVGGASATTEGLTYKVFAPTPAATRQTPESKPAQ